MFKINDNVNNYYIYYIEKKDYKGTKNFKCRKRNGLIESKNK